MAGGSSSCHSHGMFYEQRMQDLFTLSALEGSLFVKQHPRFNTD